MYMTVEEINDEIFNNFLYCNKVNGSYFNKQRIASMIQVAREEKSSKLLLILVDYLKGKIRYTSMDDVDDLLYKTEKRLNPSITESEYHNMIFEIKKSFR